MLKRVAYDLLSKLELYDCEIMFFSANSCRIYHIQFLLFAFKDFILFSSFKNYLPFKVLMESRNICSYSSSKSDLDFIVESCSRAVYPTPNPAMVDTSKKSKSIWSWLNNLFYLRISYRNKKCYCLLFFCIQEDNN